VKDSAVLPEVERVGTLFVLEIGVRWALFDLGRLDPVELTRMSCDAVGPG